MQYRNLGRSGVKVSTLCLGGMTFGEADASSMMHGASSSQEEAFAVLDHAVAGGINFMNQHLSYSTLVGGRKYDFPQSFGEHDSWWGQYHVLADYFARLSLALSAGETRNETLILEPTTSA